MSDLSQSYPPEPSSVARVRHALVRLASAAGAAREQLDAVGLAVSEAMTRAVTRSRAPIHVSAALASDGLAVSIADGAAAVPRDLLAGAAPGLPPGLDLALIAELSDAVVVAHRPSGGRALTMRFGLSPRT